MKTLIAALAITLIITSLAFADVTDYAFRITVDRDASGKFANWIDIPAGVVTVEVDPATSLPKTYTDDERPDSNCLSREDLQKWYISSATDDNLSYKVTFLATGAGLTLPKGSKVLVYGFTYTKNSTVATPIYVTPGSSVIQIGGKAPVPAQNG